MGTNPTLLRHPSPTARFARGYRWQAASSERSAKDALRSSRTVAGERRRAHISNVSPSATAQNLGATFLTSRPFPRFSRATMVPRLRRREPSRPMMPNGSSTSYGASVTRPSIRRCDGGPARLRAHNGGQNPSTAPWKPWAVSTCASSLKASAWLCGLRSYSKSGSGHGFASGMNRPMSQARSAPSA